MSQNNSLSVRDELEEIRVGSKTYSIDLLGAIFINKKKVRIKMQLPTACPISNKEMVFDRGGKWLLRHQQSNYLFEKSQILMSFFRKFYVLFQPRGCDKLFHELNIHLFKKSLWIFVRFRNNFISSLDFLILTVMYFISGLHRSAIYSRSL